jgi:hypothetical protein
MDIGQEKRPNPIGWLGRVKHQQCYPPSWADVSLICVAVQ